MTGRRPRGDRGEITLPGLLMACAMSLVIMTAVLDTFAGAQNQSTQLTARNANQQTVRATSDQIAAALRNLASPTPDQPQAIDVAGPYDLVFQNVDPTGPNTGDNVTNVRRERWCLSTAGQLYTQRQTWTTATVPAAPSTAACPGTGWGTTAVVAEHLTNVQGGLSRALFTYSSATLTDIAAVHVDMYVDEDVTRAPEEVHLATGVFLRNQNRRPIASFTATVTAQGIVLNASSSVDPEGQPMTYTWYDGATNVASGVTATYKVTAGTSHTLSLQVKDPAILTGTSAIQTVIG